MLDDRSGAYHSIRAYFSPVEHHASHAYEATVLYRAAVQDATMTDRHIVTYRQRVYVVGDMENTIVLDVGSLADLDPVNIAAC